MDRLPAVLQRRPRRGPHHPEQGQHHALRHLRLRPRGRPPRRPDLLRPERLRPPGHERRHRRNQPVLQRQRHLRPHPGRRGHLPDHRQCPRRLLRLHRRRHHQPGDYQHGRCRAPRGRRVLLPVLALDPGGQQPVPAYRPRVGRDRHLHRHQQRRRDLHRRLAGQQRHRQRHRLGRPAQVRVDWQERSL